MTYVITDDCIQDALCGEVCPSDAIHPRYSDSDFEKATQLFINPDECMDCGGCARVCPVRAIYPARDVPKDKPSAIRLNYLHFLRK